MWGLRLRQFHQQLQRHLDNSMAVKVWLSVMWCARGGCWTQAVKNPSYLLAEKTASYHLGTTTSPCCGKKKETTGKILFESFSRKNMSSWVKLTVIFETSLPIIQNSVLFEIPAGRSVYNVPPKLSAEKKYLSSPGLIWYSYSEQYHPYLKMNSAEWQAPCW